MCQFSFVPAVQIHLDPLAEFYQHSAEGASVPYCDHRSGERTDGNGPQHKYWTDQFRRWGEARHPGPTLLASMQCSDLSNEANLVRLGCSNPSGLRQKEILAIDHGPGVWGYSESQLSTITKKTSTSILKSLASQNNRQLRVHTGADVRTRHNSLWAGSWSGVVTTSDFASQVIAQPWPAEIYNSGRVVTTRHVIHGIPLLHTTVYGFPRGPTWPQAFNLTSRLLETITTEQVLGSRGPRVVVGDMNCSLADLQCFRIWERHGWRSLQSYMAELYGWEILPTSKHKCERDYIWMSPEALLMVRSIQMHEIFAEHASLSADLEFPQSPLILKTWPLPQKIPWHQVKDSWRQQHPEQYSVAGSAEECYAQIFQDMERSLDGHLCREGPTSLGTLEKGRAQRLTPVIASSTASCPRPSRTGEVVMRNNLLGTEVVRWFRQLRRLESLKHALAAGKQTASAEAYRAELRSAILHAPGFEGGFLEWWSHKRLLGVEGVPAMLSRNLPSLPDCLLIFDSFKLCYEKFESWNLRSRGRQLRAKYEHSMKSMYQDLKSASKDGPDLLHYDRSYEILAVDPETEQVHVSESLDTRGVSLWSIDGESVQVQRVTNEVCVIRPTELVHSDAVLCQKQLIASVSEVHADLVDHWSARWNALIQPTQEEWGRILAFFKAFIPKVAFDLPALTVPMWRSALKRYSERSARGVDGVSHLDLKHLPDSMTQSLLDMLTAIESGTQRWPHQLLVGIVVCLAKTAGAHQVHQFRPVVIFGIIYRTWASIRSRQLIAQLQAYVPGSSYGFLPQSECSQVWLQLQSTIEMALIEKAPWCGLNTDLKRAFNTIPRDHSQKLAEQLGVPDGVLTAWRSFMDNCTRLFQVGQYLSEGLHSTVGVPEGCALSVYMMIQLSMSMHVYLKHFNPTVWATSYVDNIGLAASSVIELSGAWVSLQEFLRLWRMEPDIGKSYVWATQSGQRAQLKSFDIEIVQHASELGGALSFSKKHVQAHFKARNSEADVLWHRLKVSMAPQRQKLYALRSVMWPRLLHGNDAHLMPSSRFTSLRSKALQTLRINKAGVNPQLRLTFSGNMEHDPEFFHVRRTIRSFRRLCEKEPILLQRWKLFMMAFDGRYHDGPFSKMVSLFSMLGWSLHPPCFTDHDGISYDFMLLDVIALDHLLEEAWCQHVAVKCKRSTSQDLQGIDVTLATWVSRGLHALDSALVASLQAGAFLSQAAQAKFDVCKTSQCAHCQQKDTHAHWIACPAYVEHHADVLDVPLLNDQTDAIKFHLLPSRNTAATQLKQYLAQIDEEKRFLSTPSSSEQHLFCDGSCVKNLNPWLSRAAWACVNATSGLLLAVGQVPGIWQSSDLAELHGLDACLAWACQFRVLVHVWSDSKYVVDAAKWLWTHRRVPVHWQHRSLWLQILEYMSFLDELAPTFHWVPSHMDPSTSSDPFDDWWILWNQRADEAAGRCNDQRGAHYWQLLHDAGEYQESQMSVLQKLRAFYLSVAKKENRTSPETSLPEMPEMLSGLGVDPLSECLSIGWRHQCVQLALLKGTFSTQFYVDILDWVLNNEDVDATAGPVSFLEITFGLVDCTAKFPFFTDGHWQQSALADKFERPTLAYLLGVVRRAFKGVAGDLGFDCLLCSGLNLSQWKVFMPCDGMYLSLKKSTLDRCRERLFRFCSSRSLRRACDLARPVV